VVQCCEKKRLNGADGRWEGAAAAAYLGRPLPLSSTAAQGRVSM